MPFVRQNIYYWKCDRAAAFHGTSQNAEVRERPELQSQLAAALARRFKGDVRDLRPAGGQGNHLTFLAVLGGREAFIRIEDGPEQDDYLKVESAVLATVNLAGVPTPRVYAVDAGRSEVPFAWQVLERIPCPDLNQLHKDGRLGLAPVARQIGALVARWQDVAPAGFGPFRTDFLDAHDQLAGYHGRYADYYHTALERHLTFLVDRAFLAAAEADAIRAEIARHASLLALPSGCLVHKDLALWNILGTPERIAAVIDWDDCIAGDPMDDLSLLGCFYDGAVLREAFAGYAAARPLPPEYRRRFWLHLLRNMLVKAVIRVGAGYFDLGGGFFLLGPGSTGADLRQFTAARIRAALHGLQNSLDPESL